jgi:hypothetical protein
MLFLKAALPEARKHNGKTNGGLETAVRFRDSQIW